MDRLAPFALLAALLAVAACTGAAGDPCQEPDDCNSGLICCKTSAGLATRGVCARSCDSIVRDAGPREDAGPPVDAGAAVDAGFDGGPDGGAEDAGVDGGPEPDGGSDAGPPEDAGPDGG